MSAKEKIALESGLDLGQLCTKGSVLHIKLEDDWEDPMTDSIMVKHATKDFIGDPIESFEILSNESVPVDGKGFIRKKIIEEGGGIELHDGCTVSIVYSGYWEGDDEPFDVRPIQKPMVVDLKENSLLPGLLTAVKSMLVNELSVFLLSYQVMYGEMGVPPRIPPKATCAFYIRLAKSIKTPKNGEINFSEPNQFGRVHREVKLLYKSGVELNKAKNYNAASQQFRRAVFLLHKVRLADENEANVQEKLLIKLYTNLAICYNKMKQPLRTCTACNEIRRLTDIWNCGKVLFQNAKALRMIGDYDNARKRLVRALKLFPGNEEMLAELKILDKTKEACNQSKLIGLGIAGDSVELVSKEFKSEILTVIKNFKANPNLCKLTLPAGLSPSEVDYVKKVCIEENVFCNKLQRLYALDREDSSDMVCSEFDDLML